MKEKTTDGFSINVDYREWQDENFRKYIKNEIINYIGNEIINKSKELNFEEFKGKQKLDIEIFLENELMPHTIQPYGGKRLTVMLKTRTPIILEKTLVTRKQEVSVNSKYYCGQKLNWHERIEALFKGRLYGGSEKIKRIQQ